jgi:hypothetical protein
VVTGGVRLAYEVSGSPDAPPMVLLHALEIEALGILRSAALTYLIGA